MNRYMKYIKPYMIYFILAPLMMIIEVIGEISMPYWFGKIIDIGIVNGDTSYIMKIGAIMVATALMLMLTGLLCGYFAAKASVNFGADLRLDIFARIQEFSFTNLNKFNTGSLVTRLTNDITQLENMVVTCLRMMLRASGILIGAVIMSFVLDWQLALILIIILPIVIAIIVFLTRKMFYRFGVLQQKLDKVNISTQELLRNIRVIKSFVRKENEAEKFEVLNEELKDTSVYAYKISILQIPLMTFFVNLATVIIVLVAGIKIMGGNMEIGVLSTMTVYSAQILLALRFFSMILVQLTRALASAKRISEVLDEKIDLVDIYAKEKDKEIKLGSVEFKNVSFKYYKDREEKVLDDISFKIESGETVGIIGSTGSGKTTLVQMIPRLYDVDEGEVIVDGVNVKDYSLKNLRDGVGVVLQQNLLFSGSVLENLRWGDKDATLEDAQKNCEYSQAHKFVKSFSEGYETTISQGGLNLSGGQKQRLCLARTFLKKSKIIILDDATSAVDTATERQIQDVFGNEFKEYTKIIIAQRISSIRDADKIIVVDNGKIAGIGTHKELINSCCVYAEICDSQIKGERGVE